MRKVIENKHFKNCKKSNCFIIDSRCKQGDINRYAQSISDIDDYVHADLFQTQFAIEYPVLA